MFNCHLIQMIEFEDENFNPYESQIVSHARVWIKLDGLSSEYWHPKILMHIARGAEIPLKIDPNTLARRYGYYAEPLATTLVSANTTSTLAFIRTALSWLLPQRRFLNLKNIQWTWTKTMDKGEMLHQHSHQQ